jgi:hypothetical protein
MSIQPIRKSRHQSLCFLRQHNGDTRVILAYPHGFALAIISIPGPAASPNCPIFRLFPGWHIGC